MSSTDTANASSTVDGQFASIGPIGQGGSVNVTVTGRGGVPAGAVGAVALNVTAANPTAAGFLTVWPAGAPRPVASNLNFLPGQTVPNMVIVPVGVNGQISIFNNAGGVDVIVDVLGWFPTGSSFTGLSPSRLMDTRVGGPTVDGQFSGVGPFVQGVPANLTVLNRGGVPASGVGAVALNVTATGPTAAGYLTVWPAGAPRPTASNLNFSPGQTVPNMVIVPVGAGGQVSLFDNAGAVDVIVDVLGWFPATGSFTGLSPARLMDTRVGGPTADGQFSGTGAFSQGVPANLTVTGRSGVPASGVGAVALNVTATGPTASGYLTVWPAGAPRPTASNLNFLPGQTVPNMVIVPVGAGGQISIFDNAGAVDVIVDVLGWFPAGSSFTGLTPARLMDTRTPGPVPPAVIGPVRNLLVVRPAVHQMSGTDRIAVWVCDVPLGTTNVGYVDPLGPGTRYVVDPKVVAAWAQASVGPYFDTASFGRYETSFIGLGHIPLAVSDGPDECLHKAMAATGRPYSNVFVTDDTTRGDGFGGPGFLSTSDAHNLDLFDVPPSQSGRGMWVGGLSTVEFPSPSMVVHEIGHTLHWPHSYIGPASEYDGPTDVMSGNPTDGWCQKPVMFGTESWPCVAQNTLAFNRFAAGWIDDGQVRLQSSGAATVTLDAPSGAGIQMIAAPDPGNSHVMLTLEARPRVGPDRFFLTEGVAAFIVDQRPGKCNLGGYYSACISTFRRQMQAIGAPDTYGNILQLGTTTMIDGVTITVTAHTGNTFTVQVSGTFTAPA